MSAKASNIGTLISRARGMAQIWAARHLNRVPRDLPILVIMITDKCNLHCKMCGACDYSPGDHGMLTLDEWKAVVDSAARLNTQILSITGGEALLRKDVFELIRYIRSHGIAVHLNTNGLLLTDKHIRELRGAGVGTVSISIESADRSTHDDIRGAGTFERTVQNLRRLRELAPEIRVGLNCVINKHNVRGLDGLVRLGSDAGVHQIKFAPIHTNLQHKDKPVGEYEHMIFEETDLALLDGELARVRRALAETDLQSTSDRFFDGISDLYRAPASNFYCYAGWAISVIDAQGNVAACFDKAGAINVREMPLHEIWRSPRFHAHRQLVRRCDKACWDTTNAELSLRMNVRNLLLDPKQTWRDIRFYFSENGH
ncbi:MAG: radical SAM protein [Candidatus Hydrogenedentes bacterium]|nr:radical SAM protein [Candidatus Hydrogenedentota bacterium]